MARLARSAEEWTRLLAFGEEGISAITEELQAWPGDPAPALAALWRLTSALPPGQPARGAAIALAFRIGAPEAARQVAEGTMSEDPVRRRLLLRTYLQEARRQSCWEQAAWAAEELAELAESPTRSREWRAQAADMLLRGQDTVAAHRSFERLAAEALPGTATHRLASRRLFSLLAASKGGVSAAEGVLESYVRNYPAPASERVKMATELVRAYVRADDLDRAGEVWEALVAEGLLDTQASIDGERALLALYRGQVEWAVALLRRAVVSPAPAAERTRWIRLLGTVGPADSAEVSTLGRFLLQRVRDPDSAGASRFLAELAEIPVSAGRPSILAVAAEALSSGGRDGEAAKLRRALVTAYPQRAETALALLELGRYALAADPTRAREWLERLVVDHPSSAVAPVARRLLAELGERETGLP